MKATKVYRIELLFAMEPQASTLHADTLCDRLLDGVREYLTSLGYDVAGGSVRSSTQLYLEAEPGDDVSRLAGAFETIH